MLYEDVTLNDEQIFSNRLECDKNTLRWVETDLSTGPRPANCCLFEKQTFQYFHTNLTTAMPSLAWYLNCDGVLVPGQQTAKWSGELRSELWRGV